MRNLRERDHLENPGINGRIISIYLQEVEREGMDWIDLAQHTDRWWALVKTVLHLLQVP